MATATGSESFGAFFRRYTKTWMHAVATAGLTAFGTLTFVHRGFAVLALACYTVPPIVLYLSRRGEDASDDAPSPTEAALSEREDGDERTETGDRSESAERDEATERSATAAGTDSLGPPPAEPDADAGAERSDEAKRGSAGARPAAEGQREATQTGGASDGPESSPSSEPERESTVEAGGPTEPDDDDVEPEPEPEPTATSAPETEADAESEPEPEPEWHLADAPTEETLLDAAIASAGAVAVGEDGVVVARDGEEWTVVLEDGPAAQGQTLSGVDVTDDGGAAWVAGDGGAVGRLDLASGRHTDYSAPEDRTDNLAGIAVAGGEGEETILAINGSGEVLRGRYRDGDCSWDDPATPGSGSSLSDVVLGGEIGYCCDTNDGVFATEDGGRSFERIGIEGADGTPAGIAAGEGGSESETCHLCTDAGVVHRYDGSRWTPERVCEDALAGITSAGERLAVCTAEGAIRERDGPTADWKRVDADAPAGLEAIALGDELGVAVGSEGTVIERR